MNILVENLLRQRCEKSVDLLFPSPRTGLKATSIKKSLAAAAGRAGIEHLGSRVLRRTFATMLDELNYDSSTVAKLLGHSDLRSVHKYKRGTVISRSAVDALANVQKRNAPISLPPENAVNAALNVYKGKTKQENYLDTVVAGSSILPVPTNFIQTKIGHPSICRGKTGCPILVI